MSDPVTLTDFLDRAPVSEAVRHAISAIADGAMELAILVARGRLTEGMATLAGVNTDGDGQTRLDLAAHEIMTRALARAPVAYIASEELDEILVQNPNAGIAVAIDPLDGSSNIETNLPMGTIFSIIPSDTCRPGSPAPFDAAGSNQLAAGFFIYGAHTALVMSCGDGVQIFTLDQSRGRFVLTKARVEIPPDRPEYAINASNYRYWDPVVRRFIDTCNKGADGPFGENYNMRWAASLVAETYRILGRGGVFLYPGDTRAKYGSGRLRLVYEARPIAFIIEQAGGSATTGHQRILDVPATNLHQRVPLIFGPTAVVEALEHAYAGKGTPDPACNP